MIVYQLNGIRGQHRWMVIENSLAQVSGNSATHEMPPNGNPAIAGITP